MELRRIKLCLGLAVLGVLLAVVTVLADEIIVNGTFDTGDDWTYGSLAEWTAGYDHTGNEGGAAIMEAYNDPDSCVWQSLPTDPGTITVSGWVRSESSTGMAVLVVLVDGECLLELGASDVTDTWENMTGGLTIPEGATAVEVQACNAANPGPDVIFDDISVDFQPAPPPTTFNELSTYTITVYGLVAIALVLSEQLARLLYYAMWRLRR